MDRSKFDEMMAKSAPPSIPGATSELVEQDQSPGMQFGFDVVEAQRINLQPNDVLMVTVKNDEITQDTINGLRKQLQLVFPNNKVFVFAMGTNDDVNLSIVSQSENPVASCAPAGYCNDCTCGKKEQAIGESNAEQLPSGSGDQVS